MRTRFAPSPTGMLHIGGLRVALFEYLMAKQTGSHFILRIEDTDQERSVEGALENILETLHWAGLDPDEGVMMENGTIVQKGDKGPYIQSERLAIYKEHAMRLIESGHAYYAFDTKDEIDAMRSSMEAGGVISPKYDVNTRMKMKNSLTLSPEEVQKRIDAGEDYVIRLKVPPMEMIESDDMIRGKTIVKSVTVDDAVLLKSDGFPTYHLANVVDDHLMDIDLVLRGEEWLPSLPKHTLLYRAFGWEPPKFAHAPLLLNKGGGKLSKRQGDVSAIDYMHKGYLKEAVINFLALLGWNPGTTQDLFTMDELLKQFSLDRVQKAGAVFDTDRLDWLQGQWMRKMPVDEFTKHILPLIAKKHPEATSDKRFGEKAVLIQERIMFFHEAPEMMGYFYEDPDVSMELLADAKQKVTKDLVPVVLSALVDTLSKIDEADWHEENLKTILFSLADEKGWKKGQLLWPMRAALTGRQYSPGAFEVAAVLGKEVTLRRLERAVSCEL